MLFAPFLSILENALMAIIFQREDVVITPRLIKEQFISSRLFINHYATPANQTLTQQNPIKDSLNIRPN